MGGPNRTEEPFSFDAREFLRQKVIGKKCEFTIEYTISARDYGYLIVDEEVLNLSIAKAGLAKVFEKKGNMQVSKYHDELLSSQEEAKKSKKGVWS